MFFKFLFVFSFVRPDRNEPLSHDSLTEIVKDVTRPADMAGAAPWETVGKAVKLPPLISAGGSLGEWKSEHSVLAETGRGGIAVDRPAQNSNCLVRLLASKELHRRH